MAFVYDTIDGNRVEANAAIAFRRMAADFQRDTGCSLHVRDGVRTYQDQVDIFLSRYVTAGEVNGRYVYDTRVWNGTRYYRVSSAGTVAVPGTSNHEEDGPNGPRSIDIYDSGDDPGVTSFGTYRDGWMQRNAGNYGFENEGNNFDEPWHKKYIGPLADGSGGGSGGGSTSSFPARDLKGADWVIAAQQKLIRLGYNLGPSGADGYDGEVTQAAVRDVQARTALNQDGIYGDDTNARVDLLLSVTNGHKGFPLPGGYWFGIDDGTPQSISGRFSYGPDLKAWQEQMQKRGWTLDADGIFGGESEQVTKDFQTDKKLTADGKIGPVTWNAAWEAPVTPPGGGNGGGTTPTPGGDGRNATLDSDSLVPARATKDIQAFLKVPQTGNWDQATSDAVAAFQRAEEIDDDRIWGITCDGLAFPPKNFGRLIDFSFARPPMDKLNRHLIVGLGRYLWKPKYDDGRTNKGLSREEATGYLNSGKSIFQIYEADGKELLGGFQAGVEAAKAAEAYRVAAGLPACAVYFNVDYNAPDEDLPAILAALDGAASVIGLDRVGLYAGYYIIKAAFDAGKIKWGFQTYAWSRKVNSEPIHWDERAQLRQWSNGQWGDSVDFVWAMAPEYGQNPVVPKPNPDPDPKPEPGNGGLTPEAAGFWQWLFEQIKKFFSK